jgi:hypothetical protein
MQDEKTLLVVMLYNYTTDHLLFDAFLLDTGHKLSVPIRDGAVLAPFLHGWRIFVPAAPLDTHAFENRTIFMWNKLDIIVRHGEIEHSKTREAHLVGGGLDDLVNSFINMYLHGSESVN